MLTIKTFPLLLLSGNNMFDDGINYPACSPNAISVGAIRRNSDVWHWETNSHPTLLDLLAPGQGIVSLDYQGGTQSMTGTSMAAPHVAGAMAQILEKDSSLTPNELKTLLQDTGVTVEDWKRINVEAAIDSLEPQGEASTCTESGYEQCYKYTHATCEASIAVNMYENTNNIQWGSVNDSSDPYVIGSYTFGWRGPISDQVYYGNGIEDTCDATGCDTDGEVHTTGTRVTANAPSVADIETVLSYNQEGSYYCWSYTPEFTSFRPSYGDDNPIYVLNCFDDGDCSSGNYCNKTGVWSDWSCVTGKADGQSCTASSQCSSGYCDNDGAGLADDGHCFTPNNTYFDGQEPTYCEFSIGNSIVECDERIVGEDYLGCTTGNETYFADQCSSVCGGEDRGDNVCRSSAFASGCTASSECNGVTAGTGNCTSNCVWVPDVPPVVTLVSPSNDSTVGTGNLLFNCSATDDISSNGLTNIALYGSWNGGWHANETESLAGLSNSTVFSKNLPDGDHFWNCLARDTSSNGGWGDNNYTISVDTTAPTISIDYPSNTTYTSPRTELNYTAVDLGVGLDSCWYSLDDGLSNTTVVCGQNITGINPLNQNGSRTWRVYANDSFGNENSGSVTFFVDIDSSVDMNFVYPTGNIDVSQNVFFNVTFNVSCFDVDCGDISVTLDPEEVNRDFTSDGLNDKRKGNGYIGSSGERWIFDKTKVDELDGDLEYLGNNTFKFTPISVDREKTEAVNYKWKTRIDYQENKFTDVVLRENLDKEELGKEFVFTIPEDVTKFSLYFGETSTQVDATAANIATSYGSNENICVDSNGMMHVAYEASGSDLWYANSTDGITWSTKELLSGTVTHVGIVCHPNDDITVYYLASSDLDMYQSSDGGSTFTGPTVVEDDVDNIAGPISGSVDSSNVVHWCGIDDDDDLMYVNSSRLDQGIIISTDDSDHCDIEVDLSNNVYIAVSETSTDDLDIMTNSDSWGVRTSINDGLGAVASSLYAGLSIAIDDSNNIYVAGVHASDLQYCKGTTALSSWACQELDSSASFNPDIAVTEAGDVYILYQGGTGDGYIYAANSSDGTNFDTRTQIQSSSSWVSVAQSTYPSSNRINDVLHYVFTDSSDVYYDNLSVSASSSGPSGLNMVIGPDWDTYVDSSESTTAHNGEDTLEVFSEIGGNHSFTLFEFSVPPVLADAQIIGATINVYVNQSNLDDDEFTLMPARWNSSTTLHPNITYTEYLDLIFAGHQDLPCCNWLDFDNSSAGWMSVDVSNILESQIADWSIDSTLTMDLAHMATACTGGTCPVEGENVLLDSMEGEHAPYLNISYTPGAKGIIPTTPGAKPFYTNASSNPLTINLNAGDSELVTFWVNATGEVNTSWAFFGWTNVTRDMSITDITNVLDITII